MRGFLKVETRKPTILCGSCMRSKHSNSHFSLVMMLLNNKIKKVTTQTSKINKGKQKSKRHQPISIVIAIIIIDRSSILT